jgi:hypothetical protein
VLKPGRLGFHDGVFDVVVGLRVHDRKPIDIAQAMRRRTDTFADAFDVASQAKAQMGEDLPPSRVLMLCDRRCLRTARVAFTLVKLSWSRGHALTFGALQDNLGGLPSSIG